MLYKLLFWIFFPTVVLGQAQTTKNNCNCNVILFQKQQKVPLLDDKGNVLYHIMDDTTTEDYFGINIIKVKNGLAFVSASATLHDTLPKFGWVSLNFLGIYPSSFSSILLYSQPNIKAKIKSKIFNPEYSPFSIKNCKGKWLYISYLDIDKRKKEGWLSPKDQCANPYSTCN